MDHITVDSCHSRWVFDTERRRFRRILKGLGFDAHKAMTEWRPYRELQLDPNSESFVVVLDDAGTRMLRSWRHTGPSCPQCGDTGTEELALDDIATVVDG
jgi:hypothetical protein